jgi:hypothetical protein
MKGIFSVVVIPAALVALNCTRQTQGSGRVYEVYSSMLQRESHLIGTDILLSDVTHPIMMCRSTEEGCWLSSVPPAFRAAADDYVVRNATEQKLDLVALPGLTVHLRSARRMRPHGCTGVPGVAVSGVGFNGDSTKAIAAFAVSVGEGPRPGCGSSFGGAVALDRGADGQWVVQDLLKWKT